MGTTGASSAITIGNNIGTPLTELLCADAIIPGTSPSYQICKLIYLYHPLGAKIVESPIEMAQSQSREIHVPKGPEERVVEKFRDKWQEMNCDTLIFNVCSLARTYGISSLAMLVDGQDSAAPLNTDSLRKALSQGKDITFNLFDPLNTAGSLVLNQIPTAKDFLKPNDIVVQGERYHRTRVCIMMNEQPIYIAYTDSAFGFVGRSVYQRGLYMLKSYVNTMITDDLVAQKAGLVVAKMKQPGSIIDTVMQSLAAVKRNLLKEARVGNVISIQPEEDIESINLQNLSEPYALARKNIIENVATACGMPAKLLLQESFAEGFGEGTEDAKYVAQYIERFRQWMHSVYCYFDWIVQIAAWDEEFYATIQDAYPEYAGVSFETAFAEWRDSFSASWPSLIREPESELIKVAKVKLEALIALIEVLAPLLDPENMASIIETCLDNVNELKELFDSPFEIDIDALLKGMEEKQAQQQEMHENAMAAGEDGMQEPKPKPGMSLSAKDSDLKSSRVRRALDSMNKTMDELQHMQHMAKMKRKKEARANGAAH